MTAIERIKAAQQAGLVDEEGEPVTLDLMPPLTPERIDSLRERVGMPLPEELRTLLTFCSGIERLLGGIDFTGESLLSGFGYEEIFPAGLPIAADGFGNYWALDITPQTELVAPVFFACHDPPVILYQSPDIATFLTEVFRMYTPPYQSLIEDVHDDRLFRVWSDQPGAIGQPAAATSTDPVLREFALGLPENFEIVDLRDVEPGMGFPWGCVGPNTEVRRHGYERIFGYEGLRRSGPGFFARLFGHKG